MQRSERCDAIPPPSTVAMLLGVCTLTLVPQRAFITRHRSHHRQHAVSMEAVSAPQAPPQTVSSDEQHEAFAAIIDRCDNFAEDFDGFQQVAEDLREVFDADFQQYKLELRAAATSQNASPLRLHRAARPSASWRFRGLSQ